MESSVKKLHPTHIIMPPRYAVIDTEIGLSDHKVHDIGALTS